MRPAYPFFVSDVLRCSTAPDSPAHPFSFGAPQPTESGTDPPTRRPANPHPNPSGPFAPPPPSRADGPKLHRRVGCEMGPDLADCRFGNAPTAEAAADRQAHRSAAVTKSNSCERKPDLRAGCQEGCRLVGRLVPIPQIRSDGSGSSIKTRVLLYPQQTTGYFFLFRSAGRGQCKPLESRPTMPSAPPGLHHDCLQFACTPAKTMKTMKSKCFGGIVHKSRLGNQTLLCEGHSAHCTRVPRSGLVQIVGCEP